MLRFGIYMVLGFVPNVNQVIKLETIKFYDQIEQHDLRYHHSSCRIKTFKSASLKAQRFLTDENKHESLVDTVYDLVAFRFVFYDSVDLMKFFAINKSDKKIYYYKNYITDPKPNGYQAIHFRYHCNYNFSPLKSIECQLYIINHYYDSLYGNSSQYKNYTIQELDY